MSQMSHFNAKLGALQVVFAHQNEACAVLTPQMTSATVFGTKIPGNN
jgi:hypothetical protein